MEPLTTEAYQVAKWFIEEVRGEGWYYPKHVKDLSSAKAMLKGGKDPEGEKILPFTVEQIKTVTNALVKGCHLTDWKPLQHSDERWMADSNGPKGLWVIRRLIYSFFNDPPECPPYWEQPRYDDWVMLFGTMSFAKGKFMVYAGWSQQGPEKSGLHPDALRELFSDDFVQVSLSQWRSVYEQK